MIATQDSTFPLGATIVADGVQFAVWAPHADRVAVVGTFNDHDEEAGACEKVEGGCWQAFSNHAKPGDEYHFVLYNQDLRLERIDPYAREVTHSAGTGIIHDRNFDWGDDKFEIEDWNKLVMYEMHIGTFNRPAERNVGTFADAIAKLDYLQQLGINAIELMPTAEFAGDLSWGYNPALPFAVEESYGGPNGLREFVRAAHQHGIGVIMDVVYNHLGPSDLHLWRFDGWSENGKGGIYFFNDHRSSTPWGDSRPDYGRGEVRQYLLDNAMMWLDEYRVDGLRYDMTLYMRTIDGNQSNTIPEGWSLLQWINSESHRRFPKKLMIAEDLQSDEALTKPDTWGGANFDAQWDAEFVHPIRQAMAAAHDADRSIASVRDAVLHRYNHDAFERVIYTESHDEVANGSARLPSEIDGENPESLHARKRSTLGAALVMTAPGIPMLFQGQEFLRTGWFQDVNAIDWSRPDELPGILQLYRDLISLRRNQAGNTSGLQGQRAEVILLDEDRKVIAYRRWNDQEDSSSVVCVANLSHDEITDLAVSMPDPGTWELRFNSDAECYGCSSGKDVGSSVTVDESESKEILINMPSYSMLIYSQNA